MRDMQKRKRDRKATPRKNEEEVTQEMRTKAAEASEACLRSLVKLAAPEAYGLRIDHEVSALVKMVRERCHENEELVGDVLFEYIRYLQRAQWKTVI